MSKLKELKIKLAQIILEASALKTDKGILNFAEDGLAVGTVVWFEDEEGNRTDVADGDYIDDDKRTIVIKDTKVEEIKEVPAEEEVKEAPAEEKVVEETPIAAEEETKEETPAETDAIAELRKEVDELYKLVDSILDKIGESRKEADEEFKKLDTRCAAIEKQSAAKPAEEEFEVKAKVETYGNKKLENFKKFFE